MQVLLTAASGAVFPTPSAWDVRASASAGLNAGCRLTYGGDGSITKTITSGASAGTDGSVFWFTPLSPGIGANYYIRFTVTSGAFTSSSGFSTGQWLLIGAGGQYIGQADATTDQDCIFTVDISKDGTVGGIVYTITTNHVRRTHP
jgi:hypothetical protein